ESFKKVFLDTHNAYRAEHDTPALSYSSELCAIAQKWADHLLQNNTFAHSQTSDGENIYCSTSSAPVTPKNEAVDSWYSEIKDYNFKKPGYNNNTGHFTQVVWKDSTELGVGVASSGKKVFVVGQYRPAGNMNSPMYFQENVLPKG
uniref:SCP domain-containing protein n=1 Tax=Periophthalmus magnuspinnatus TaxID=409849 RepID=A0A3B3Z6V5_9GOBI